MTTFLEPILDLTMRHATYRHAGIEVVLTWALTNGRPCLVLIPQGAMPTHEAVTPCIVPMESAWQWSEEIGDVAACVRSSHAFASALGFNPNNPYTLIAITAAIREHLGDLLDMPALSMVADREVVADAVVTNVETGEQREQEIVDNVQPRG